MSDGLLYYFGDDKVFFNNLKTTIEAYASRHLDIEVKKFFATQEGTIQSLFLEVSRMQPDVVVIDFSLHFQDYIHLARILSRALFEKEIKVIGILDHQSPQEMLVEVQTTGVSLSFIKSDDINDTVQNIFRITYPKNFTASNFAKVKLKEEWTAGVLSKIGYITEKGLHFETNLSLSLGEMIRVRHFWQNKYLVPSKCMTVKSIQNDNLIYHFERAINTEFEFIDPIIGEKTPEDEVKRISQIEDVKYRYTKFFFKNLGSSTQKIAKVLIVDSQYILYQSQKRSDRFPYILRCVGNEKHVIKEIARLKPHIIVFSLDDNINDKTVTLVKNWLKQNVSGDRPYLIIFNSSTSTKDWQALLDYENILSSSGEMNTDVLIKMAKIFESKVQIGDDDKTKKLYVSKVKEESNCEIEISIEVNYLTESDLQFTSSRELPLHTNLVIRNPIQTLVYLVAVKEQNGIFSYQGILHSHNELEKNSIRRYINSSLFQESEAKVVDKKEIIEENSRLMNILKNSKLKSED
jgi:hypothetical protein